MPTVRVPLVGSFTTRGSTKRTDFTTYDQLFQNCTFQIVQNPVTGSSYVAVDRRPGFIDSTDTSANFSEITNAYNWKNLSAAQIVYAGIQNSGTNARIRYGANYTHASADRINFISETYNSSGTASLVWQRENGEAWIYPNGGAVAQISGIPSGNAGRIVYLDGYAFIAVAATATVRNSALNDPTTWPSDGAIVAQEDPDRLVSLSRLGNFIVAFGESSVEFFENAGNPVGSPLLRVPRMRKKIGLSLATLMANGMDRIFFVSRSEDYSKGVYSLSLDGIEKLSNPTVDAILQGITGTGQALSYFVLLGSPCIMIAWDDDVSPKALVLDLTTKIWSYWTSSANLLWHQFVWQQDYPITDIFTGCTGSGRIWSMSNTGGYYYDGGVSASQSPIERIIRTRPLDSESGNRKTERQCRLIGDRATSTHNIAYSYSDDDFANFTSRGNIDMSAADPKIVRNGTFRRRSRRFVDSNTSRSRLESFEVEIEEAVK